MHDRFFETDENLSLGLDVAVIIEGDGAKDRSQGHRILDLLAAQSEPNISENDKQAGHKVADRRKGIGRGEVKRLEGESSRKLNGF